MNVLAGARPSGRAPFVVGGLLAALLLVLGGLQLRWLRQVADADRQRLEAGVRAGLEAVARELDGEVSRAWLAFAPVAPMGGDDPRDGLLTLWERWRESAPDPQLVARVVLVPETGDPQALETSGAASPRWVPYEGPPLHLVERSRRSGRFPFRLLRPDLPGIEIPLWSPDSFPGRTGVFQGAAFVLFAPEVIEARLRALADRYLAPVLGPHPPLRVTDRETGALVFATEDAAGGRFEWRTDLFGLLPLDELRRLAFAVGPMATELADPSEPGPRHRWPGWRGRERLEALAPMARSPRGWILATRPAAGSLERAVGRARRTNGALAFGILLLLAAATLLLVISARRAQETARRQLEFTALVSHELRTPVTAIRSLAENLADGVVRDPGKARLYGEEIARQGARLGEMLEQVLAVSTLQARGEPRREEVRLGELAREVAAEARAVVAGATVEVREEAGDSAPAIRVRGDREALRRALQNLVTNALRHGGDPPWAEIRLAAAPDGRSVRVEVSDRGPGVPAEERPHLFDPFYRGTAAREGQRAGTGLGLYLVRRTAERHGGRIELAAGEAADRGARFVLTLPTEAV